MKRLPLLMRRGLERSLAGPRVLLFLTAGAVSVAAMAAALDAQGRATPPPQAAAPAQGAPGLDVVEGELDVFVEDTDAGSFVHHFLRANGRTLRLEIPGEPPGLRSGDRVRAAGRLRGDTLALDSSSSLSTMALASPNTFGAQRTLVILVNFEDNTSVPYGAPHAHNVTFGTTSDFFLENSYGQTSFTGDVAGWYTLPMTSATCDTGKIATLAEQAAAAKGYTLSNYPRRVYAFPKITSCKWWGLGSVGGNPSRSWINGTFSLKVVAHEFGHNFGDYHSRSEACDLSGCTISEYGDNADVMGNPTSGHLNAFQKERLGWLNYGSSPAAQVVTASGAYWITRYTAAAGDAAPRALKILKGVDGSGRKSWYYVEARTQAGFDSGVAPGVILHSGSEATGNSSNQLDIAPSTSTFDSRLDPGEVFFDSARSLRISTLWTNSTGAMIDIRLEDVPCVEGDPLLGINQGGKTWTSPGTSVAWSLSLKSNDDPTCTPSTFDLAGAAPSGWTWVASPTTVTVSPGATATASLTVGPPSSASAGRYGVGVGAYRKGSDAWVEAPIDVVTELGMKLDINLAKAYELTATVTAGGAPVVGVTVTFTITDPLGRVKTLSAKTGSTGVALVTHRVKKPDPDGTYTVLASASALGLTGTDTGTFTK